MSNLEMLEKLTIGKDLTEECIINVNGEEVPVELRPLTSGELAQLQTIEKKGFVMKVGVGANGKRTSVNTSNTDVDINARDFTKYQSEALFKAVAWSFGCTEKEVKDFLPGVPEQIFNHVIRISNIKDNDLTIIKNFRKE